MIRLTYLSQESSELSADALLALVTQCHRNNPAKGLTGMLLHGNGTFLQVIEGEEAVVDQLMAAIKQHMTPPKGMTKAAALKLLRARQY